MIASLKIIQKFDKKLFKHSLVDFEIDFLEILSTQYDQ